MKKLSFFIFCLSLTSALLAQTKKASYPIEDIATIQLAEDSLSTLSEMMVHDSIPENRFDACKKFIPDLVNVLKKKNSFNYQFEKLPSVSILYPPDSTFRIFSWQIYVDKDTYQQYGAIQMNSSELKLFRLLDKPMFHPNINRVQLKADEWIGAVYYNIHQFDTPQGKKYLLFGFDGHSFFTKQKIMEVLSFEDGNPIFGAPVFKKVSKRGSPITNYRLLIKYSAETTIRLNYDPNMEMVIFDHVLPQSSPFPGQSTTYLPDGSYEGYKLEKGAWIHIDKVFDHKYEENEFPVPDPVLGKESKRKQKDLFGNQ